MEEQTVSERIKKRAEQLYGAKDKDVTPNKEYCAYILGAYEYRAYLIEEIEDVLPKINYF
jgi:hypothetical protein